MPKNKQKTWSDLLGPYTENDFVLGREIIRNMDGDQYKVLWRFDDEDIAWECFCLWRDGQ